jgi:hypothetical protein
MPEPPLESIVNQTLDPLGRAVNIFVRAAFTPDQIAEFKSVFVAKHLIANEIERLMAVLDALDGDEDLELNAGNCHGDPRLDDAECDLFEGEPSLATTDAINQDHAGWDRHTYLGSHDLEQDDEAVAHG